MNIYKKKSNSINSGPPSLKKNTNKKHKHSLQFIIIACYSLNKIWKLSDFLYYILYYLFAIHFIQHDLRMIQRASCAFFKKIMFLFILMYEFIEIENTYKYLLYLYYIFYYIYNISS